MRFSLASLFVCPFALIGVGLTGLWIWMIIDCATKEKEGSEKIMWILIVILVGWIGALIYLFARKLPRDRATGGTQGTPGA